MNSTFFERLQLALPAKASVTAALRHHRRDIVIGVALFVMGAMATLFASGLLDERLLGNGAVDVWFEADIARVFSNMSDRWSNNFRANVHPLFALFVYPPVFVVRTLLGLDAWTAVRVVLAVVAGLWLASIYTLLRLVSLKPTDATVFSLLAATSAGAMFWFPIPETHTVASLTIVLAMIVVAVSKYARVPIAIEVAVSASTLGVTVTNWMAGLLAAVVRRPWSQALSVSLNAFAVVVMLWAVQKQLIPSSLFFLGNPPETAHILAPESRGALHVAGAFFLHSIVMPAITVVDRPGAGQWPIMLVQPANPGSGGVWSFISMLLWTGLLAAGLWSMVRLSGQGRLRIFIALFVAGQFVLHLLFGNETFLYSPNFLPVLIALAALSALTPMRRVVLAAACALVVTNGIGNGIQWQQANRHFAGYRGFQHDAMAAKKARPTDPWPGAQPWERIALPEARIFETGFYSPAGSLSPGLDQFAISFWTLADSGVVIRTSDDVQRDRITASITRRPDSSTAKVDVATPDYRAVWSPVGARRWRLKLTVSPGVQLALAVRGVGAYPGPVRHLEWNGSRLLVNDRWSIEPDSAQNVAVFLVNENVEGWVRARPDTRQLSVQDGWAAARLELGRSGDYTFIVRDMEPGAPVDRVLATFPR